MIQLRKALAEHINADELETFCFDLEILFENLGSGGFEAQARKLVEHCKQRGLLDTLQTATVEQRPNVRFAWPVTPSTALTRQVLVAHAPGDEALARRWPLRLAWVPEEGDEKATKNAGPDVV